MNKNYLEINNRKIGPDYPPYCIAEVGINHNGEIDIAKKMINVAKQAGADAVKFQTFKAKEFCVPGQMFTYKSQGKKVTEPMLDMFKRFELSLDDWLEIKNYCNKKDITFLSTPQNVTDLKILKKIGIPAIKVGSDDFTNLPLISDYKALNLPLILSCGMSDLSEVHQALEVAGWFDGYPVALLLCTSQYPTPHKDVNISKLTTLTNAFPGLLVGFSDHTEGPLAASLAVSRGARIFEKHFTLDKNLPGPDHWFSENPEGLNNWINNINISNMMLGDPRVIPTKAELEMRLIARRSLVALKNISKGDKFLPENIGAKRPGGGLAPIFINEILGLTASRDIKEGDKLSIGDINNEI
jgi:N,N'-diacetyllegionaminate synthase